MTVHPTKKTIDRMQRLMQKLQDLECSVYILHDELVVDAPERAMEQVKAAMVEYLMTPIGPVPELPAAHRRN